MEFSQKNMETSELIFSPDWRAVMLEEHCLIVQFDSELKPKSCNINLSTILMCKIDDAHFGEYISFLDQSLNVIGLHMLRNVNRWKGKVKLHDRDETAYITNGTLQRFSSEDPDQTSYILVMDMPEEYFIRQSIPVKSDQDTEILNFHPIPTNGILNNYESPEVNHMSTNQPKSWEIGTVIKPERFQKIISEIVSDNQMSRSQSLIFSLDSGVPLQLEPLNASLNLIILNCVQFSVRNTAYGIVAVHISWNKLENELCIDIDDTGEPVKHANKSNLDSISQALLQDIEDLCSRGSCTFVIKGRSAGNTLQIKARCHKTTDDQTLRQVRHLQSHNRLVEDFLNDKMYRDEFRNNLLELQDNLIINDVDDVHLRKILHKTTPSLFYWNHNSAYTTARNLHDSIHNNEKSNIIHFKQLLTKEITTILASL